MRRRINNKIKIWTTIWTDQLKNEFIAAFKPQKFMIACEWYTKTKAVLSFHDSQASP